MAQRAADGHTFGRLRQAVEAGGRRARRDRLADSVDQLSSKAFGIEGKEQHADAGPSVGRVFGWAISASMPASTLHPITEVANPVIDCAAVLRPCRRLRRDDDAGRAHAEGFGKCIDDPDAVALDYGCWWRRLRPRARRSRTCHRSYRILRCRAGPVLRVLEIAGALVLRVLRIGAQRPRQPDCGFDPIIWAGVTPCSRHCSIVVSVSNVLGPSPPRQWAMPGTMKSRAKSSCSRPSP